MRGEDRGSASACVRRRQPGWVSAGVRPRESGREKGALRKINGVKIIGGDENLTFFECLLLVLSPNSPRIRFFVLAVVISQ